MLFYLQSTDPNNYGIIKHSINALSKGKKRFRILQVSFITSFLVTTDQDYIDIKIYEYPNIPGQTYRISFTNQTTYEKETLPKALTELFTTHNISVSYNSLQTLTLSSSSQFEIIEASHRVKMLLGLYNSQLPIQSKDNILNLSSVPFTCYGNNLYLRSRVSSVVGINNGSEEYISICYHINEFLIPGLPVITKVPGSYVNINSYDLSNLEFTLVDFKNEPIKMTAPLFITLEIEEDFNQP